MTDTADIPDSLPLYPSWRELEAYLLKTGQLVDGAVIPMRTMRAGIGVSHPRDLNDGEEALRQQMHFNSSMGHLCASLLENHKIKLRLVDGVGYMVIPPDEQTRISMKDSGSEIACALNRAIRSVSNVRIEQLTQAQVKENSDALARLGNMEIMFGNKKRRITK